MDAAEYKHIVLGLIFLKYISDAFEEQYAKLQAEKSLGADPEDPDEYRAVNIFWVPGKARWPHLIEDVEEDGEPFDEKMERLTSELAEMFAKSQHLEEEIRKNQALIGWEI
jgi:type I restriction enzyme M protein